MFPFKLTGGPLDLIALVAFIAFWLAIVQIARKIVLPRLIPKRLAKHLDFDPKVDPECRGEKQCGLH